MRLTAIQLPAKFDAVDEQLALTRSLLAQGPQTDLVLLSEAAFTGYVSPTGQFDLTSFAEPLEGPTVSALRGLARQLDALVVGPLIERAGDHVFNSLVGVEPSGATLLHYRKRHPWFPERWATPGDRSCPIVEWRGVRLLAAICFDVHFLAADAGPALTAADLLLFSSAWVDEEDDSRTGLLEGIARQFDTAVLNANWGQGAPRLRGQGGSMFIGNARKHLGLGAGRLDVNVVNET